MRIYAWKRPNDWRVTIASRLGEQYGYSTCLLVAAWRALLVHLEIRCSRRPQHCEGSKDG